jgi:hypothetical protein
MLRYGWSLIALVLLVVAMTMLTRAGAFGSSIPSATLMTTGVYTGSCSNEITSGVLDNGAVVLYGLGNLIDPSCQNPPLPLQPMPVSVKGSLANLAVASEQTTYSVAPTTVTLYVNGAATPLSCAVSEASTGCVDRQHKIPVNVNDTFSVWATCSTDGSSNCAQGLLVTVDRLQSANQ